MHTLKLSLFDFRFLILKRTTFRFIILTMTTTAPNPTHRLNKHFRESSPFHSLRYLVTVQTTFIVFLLFELEGKPVDITEVDSVQEVLQPGDGALGEVRAEVESGVAGLAPEIVQGVREHVDGVPDEVDVGLVQHLLAPPLALRFKRTRRNILQLRREHLVRAVAVGLHNSIQPNTNLTSLTFHIFTCKTAKQ